MDTGLFSGLDPDQRASIERNMEARHLQAGEVLCKAGETGSTLYLVTAGLLHTVAANSGDILDRQRPGDIVGEAALLTGVPRSATVVARHPSEVLGLSRAAFLSVAEQHPQLLLNVARLVSQREVARTTRVGRSPQSEAVAVVIGAAGWPEVDATLAATAASSAATVGVVDLTEQDGLPTGDALAALEAKRHRAVKVFIVLRSDRPDLPMLLDYCDRTVAVMTDPEARELASTRHLTAGRMVAVAPGTRDVGSLGRHLAGTRLGLALGAGGAKSFAHVGAIRVLQRAGYIIDYVAGSSMGAWVGAWLSLGMDADEIEQTLRSAFTAETARIIFRDGAAGDPSALVVKEELARRTTGDVDFAALTVPLVVMAADLEDRCPVPITTGPVHEAMSAAITVPGLYPPACRGRQRLVDAVVLTPVPSDAVVAAGADVTVAINLLGRQSHASWPGYAEVAQRRRRDRDAVIESLELAQIDASARQAAVADVPVTPRFGPGTWWDFYLADHFIDAGAAAMEEALPTLRGFTRPHKAAR